MNVSSFVLEQALKQLHVPSSAIRQLQLAGKLSDVSGNGFPSELFQLSAPMVTRGLLNFAILQMKRDWIYPHWVHKQLDPQSKSYCARSQNPLLLNTTHRNWTLLGSPNGVHEAIIDPCGLATPLPREWSIDVWLLSEHGMLIPSLSNPAGQIYNTHAPNLITRFETKDLRLEIEAFVDTTNHGRDVLFEAIHVTNKELELLKAKICIAIRPFNPEGVAPIQHIEFKHGRQVYIDKCLGVVLAQEPELRIVSNAEKGDSANIVRQLNESESWITSERRLSISCPLGLANAAAVFDAPLKPDQTRSLYLSVALGTRSDLQRAKQKSTWQVSFKKRQEKQLARWIKERLSGASISFVDENVQKIFDANVLSLLQLHDGIFISPGPFLYHHFWFRDAAPMMHALDRLGFHKRTRQALEAFQDRLTNEGFFRGPDGEWDSNGEVLWLIEQHIALTHSTMWLQHFFPIIRQAADWICKKRRLSKDTATTHRGLLPASLSAEHFGTVDQYYWDSFWGLRGLRSSITLAKLAHKENDATRWEHEAQLFTQDIQRSLDHSFTRLKRNLIPASPSRPFDESAVGFVAGIYPLGINDIHESAFKETLDEFTNRYVDGKGYLHPIIHSGYNPYLTLQLAHAYLVLNQPERAWQIAQTILSRCQSPYSLPEAIHPQTGGGAMGDGHHGWAAAEIIEYLLDCLICEEEKAIRVFPFIQETMFHWGTDIAINGVATSFGKATCKLQYETWNQALCTFFLEPVSHRMPEYIEITFPFTLKRVLPVSSNLTLHTEQEGRNMKVRFTSSNAVLLLER